MSNTEMHTPELAEVEVDMGRGAFLVKGALAAGAIYGATAVGPFVRRALAQGGGTDVDILNFALTLEYLEAAFYEQGLQSAKLGSEAKSVAETIASDEQAHVDALKMTIEDLGGTPVEAPGVDFGSAINSEGPFLTLAQTFEDTGVSAYNGAAPMITSVDVLAAAGSIVQVEARHAAMIRLVRDRPPAPRSFDAASEMDEILKAVKPFIKG